ncbi:phage protein [Escherichia coli KOEGE 10 (25a)]|nr:phage protein [Escherichia coli KOEGE 10 (25a)]
MLGYSKLLSIKTPHGVLSKQFRYPALRGNEVSMDTIDLGNNESLVCGVFPNQDGTFTAMTYTKSKTFKTEAGAHRWLERNSGE